MSVASLAIAEIDATARSAVAGTGHFQPTFAAIVQQTAKAVASLAVYEEFVAATLDYFEMARRASEFGKEHDEEHRKRWARCCAAFDAIRKPAS